jgi:GNAT superfamily N-acetyltransferase
LRAKFIRLGGSRNPEKYCYTHHMHITDYQFKQNLDDTVKVLKSASEWRSENSIYSPAWDPEKMSRDFYLEEFMEHQAYVLYRNEKPIATATLADHSETKLGSWEDKLGANFLNEKALYVDDLAVIKELIGQGIIAELFKYIEIFSKEHGYGCLRLDFDSRIQALRDCYTKYGFREVTRMPVDKERISVYMEKPVS